MGDWGVGGFDRAGIDTAGPCRPAQFFWPNKKSRRF